MACVLAHQSLEEVSHGIECSAVEGHHDQRVIMISVWAQQKFRCAMTTCVHILNMPSSQAQTCSNDR